MYPFPPSQLLIFSLCLLFQFSLVVLWVCCEQFFLNGVSEIFSLGWGGGAGGCSPELIT